MESFSIINDILHCVLVWIPKDKQSITYDQMLINNEAFSYHVIISSSNDFAMCFHAAR